MANADSVFEKKLAPETTLDKIEAILEHLNLPPKALAFFRKNYRKIQVVTIVLVISVVSGSLYKSYREQRVEEGAAALSAALDLQGSERTARLESVVQEYSDTSSGLWARVELAHEKMKGNNFAEGAAAYREVLKDISGDGPLYPLVLFGLAQALEAAGEPDRAYGEYDRLKEIEGYQSIGYLGMARIEESRGNLEKAIAILNNFLLSAGDDPSMSAGKVSVEKRIAHLKALK